MPSQNMHSTILILLIVLLATGLSSTTLASDSGPSAAVMEKTIPSVGQVIATGCSGPENSRAGSGFVWDSAQYFVTDIHVISRCNSITVHINNADVPATLVRAYPFADLALLKLEKPASSFPLKIAAAIPTANDRVQALGYPYGEPTYDNTGLYVKIGASTLKDMAVGNVRDVLVQAGSPSLDVAILRLDGSLHPGLSGAPLINDNGEVVGIGSGGFENGTANISWAVQAHYLNDLAKASLPSVLPFPASGAVFSSPVVGQASKKVQCGDSTFEYTKTRTIGDLLKSADDLVTFYRIAATLGVDLDTVKAIKLDVYAEETSGGSVAVPEGVNLEQNGRLCVAHVADRLEMDFSAYKFSSYSEARAESLAFEKSYDAGAFFWKIDPRYTYGMNYQRADGLIVRRLNYLGYPSDFSSYSATADLYETLMSHGSTFIGVRVANTNFVPNVYGQCIRMPDQPFCQSVRDVYFKWIAAGLGTQLSTFPPR